LLHVYIKEVVVQNKQTKRTGENGNYEKKVKGGRKRDDDAGYEEGNEDMINNLVYVTGKMVRRYKGSPKGRGMLR
ncbi:hypothetical protein ACLOJK_029238, partial [Asimina triloba]